MKKIILSIGLCLCVGFAAMAQESDQSENPAFLSKRGVPLLPKAGDFAIGIDATPFLKYVGNFFNQAGTNEAPLFNGVSNTIYGKYFLEDDRAIRAKLSLGIGSDQMKGVVPNDEARANDPLNTTATTVDVLKNNYTNVELRVGYEFRRGHGRVQGFYGGEVGFGYGTSKQTYEWSNPMTSLNQRPSSYNFNNGNIGTPATRPTESKGGAAIAASIAGFAGVEFFIAPQFSIGGEFNLGFSYVSRRQSEFTTETWNSNTSSVQTLQTREGSWPQVLDNNGDVVWARAEAGTTKLYTKPSGSIFLMFYF